MRFFASPEHDELSDSVARFLRRRCGRDEVRRLMGSPVGYDRAVWMQLSGQLGLPGLAVPSEYGGAGAGFQELVTVLEQTGRALLRAPLLGSVLAGQALLLWADEPSRAELVPPIASGDLVATFAGALDGAVAARAARDESGWRIDADFDLVLDGQHAEMILLIAETVDGPTLFAVGRGAPGLDCRPLPALDQTRRFAEVRLRSAPGRRVAPVTAPERLGQIVALALAAEGIGGADACLATSVSYAGMRHQFGRPIGSFQAIQHKCADVLMSIELARSGLHYAAWALDEGDPQAGLATTIAAVSCAEAFSLAAAENIQIHGGIGFTWEHDAHLYLKRAESDRLLLDLPARRAELLAELGV